MTDMYRAIVKQPDDDLARLACSDWLVEQGEDDRAELIRVQIELHRLPESDVRAVDLELRAEELLAEHERRWLGPWYDRLVRWRFSRGFLDSVTIEPEVFLRHGEELFRQHPVREVRFVNAEGEACGPYAVEELVAHPAFAHIRALDASGSMPSAGPTWCRALAADPDLQRIEELQFASGWRQGGVFRDGEALELLCQASHLRGLRKLDLSAPMAWDALGDEVVDAILDSVFAPQLESLRLGGLALTDEGVCRLAASPRLGRLEALDLGWCENLSRDGWEALLSAKHLGRLNELSLGGNIDPALLASSPLPGQLKSLELCSNTWRHRRSIPAESWTTLAQSERIGRLRRLTLMFGLLSDEGARRLFQTPGLLRLHTLMVMGLAGDGDHFAQIVAESPALAGLTALELPGCHITSAGVRSLLEAPFIPQLRLYCVAGNPLDDASVTALTESSLTTGRLINLHLHHCSLQPETLCELMKWPGLARLTSLDLPADNLTPEAIRTLASSPCSGRLTTLRISDGELAPETLLELARVPGLSRLHTLTLPAAADPDAVAVLRERFGARVSIDPN